MVKNGPKKSQQDNKEIKEKRINKKVKKEKVFDSVEEQMIPQTSHRRQNLCQAHQSPIEFLCSQQECLKELCGHCILEHSSHIQHIISITQIINDFERIFDKVIKNPKKLQNEIKDNQINNQSKLNELKNSIHEQLDLYIDQINTTMNQNYIQQQEMIDEIGNQKRITSENGITYFRKYYLFYQQKNSLQIPQINLNKISINQQFQTILQQNIQTNYQNYNIQSSYDDAPKYLHWFEWGKKRINIYDISLNETHSIELQIGFKIPSFSRSIMLPDGKIFLLGGEEPEYFSRREIHLFDPLLNDRKLLQKSSMPHKKFDFTVCYLSNCIYVICGKDSVSEVTDSCERYYIDEDRWQNISPVNKKRYAASACGFRGNKIFLFGGRSEVNNLMVSEIECYSQENNTWTIFNVAQGWSLWSPVEVCACLQINPNQIMIFGGSDARIKDQNATLMLSVNEAIIEKNSDLRKAQVFVANPFLYGNYVYAIGNEYYMKHRCLHRYVINKSEWEIIF